MREQRRLDALARRDKIAELEDLAADLDAVNQWANLLTRAAIVAAGYRQHNRGEWRKRRMGKQSSKSGKPQESTPAVPQESAKPLTYGEQLALARRAEKGDRTALAELRELFRDPVVINRLGGDVAQQAQLALIEKFTKGNPVVRETLQRKLTLLRAELCGSCPTPLERLLVERVVSCWLHVHQMDMLYAQQDSMSLALGTYYQRCITSAQKRYLAAIKALALVRKLALPALQVNIADKQVNVAR
jgi:hypothetical protein